METLEPHERLIVAADFDGDPKENLLSIKKLCADLQGTGICIKLNADLRGDYDLACVVYDYGLMLFADLKLIDIPSTLARDAKKLGVIAPHFVTVMCAAGKQAIKALKDSLPDTKVLGVTVLTSMDNTECTKVYGYSIRQSVLTLASIGLEAEIDGFIASPSEAMLLRSTYPMYTFTINTPGIRLGGNTVRNEDQNLERVMTPADAIRVGVDRVIIGRPITQAKDPKGTVTQILEEIEAACG